MRIGCWSSCDDADDGDGGVVGEDRRQSRLPNLSLNPPRRLEGPPGDAACTCMAVSSVRRGGGGESKSEDRVQKKLRNCSRCEMSDDCLREVPTRQQSTRDQSASLSPRASQFQHREGLTSF